MAFLHFRRKNIDWGIIEVGMGGRLDATNVLTPQVSVITPVSMDHREFLGRNLAEITGEKAGIVKKGIPVISSCQSPEAMGVIEKKCTELDAPLFRLGKEFISETVGSHPDRMTFNYRGETAFREIFLPLSGEHQVGNASVAIACAESIGRRFPGLHLDIKKGIESMKCQGRAELVRSMPPTLIDGAHNPGAAEVLVRYLREKLAADYKRIILIVGIMGDKDISGILRNLLPAAAEIICTRPGYGRAAQPESLASLAASLGFKARTAETVRDALRLAESIWQEGDLIVVTGSFYTTGEAKELLVRKGVFADLRE